MSLSPVSSEQPSMGSYNKLSKFMGSWPEVAIFRRFAALNAQNLLFLQAELVRLEDDLQCIREEDAQSTDLEKKQSHQSWRSLVLAYKQGQCPNSQWAKVLEIREKLKEYSMSPPNPSPGSKRPLRSVAYSQLFSRGVIN